MEMQLIKDGLHNWLERHPKLVPGHFSFNGSKRLVCGGFRILTHSSRILPDLIIPGFHKTASTSLYYYLIQHPNIGKAEYKEIEYFSYSYWRGEKWYRSHFPTRFTKNKFEKKFKQKYFSIDGSPGYSIHSLVPERIQKLIPNAKLIFILRNPIDRAYSDYQYQFREGWEHTPSFEEAIEQDGKRYDNSVKNYKNDSVRAYNLFQKIDTPYLSVSKYVNYLENWFNYFPKENFLILLTEELESNPDQTFEKIFKFLDIPSFKISNLSKQNVGSYSHMSHKTRESLITLFKPYNERLEKLLNRKFNWDI